MRAHKKLSHENSRGHTSPICPNLQPPSLQPLACWRLYNRSANSCPLCRLDIMDIKPPISQSLVHRARQCAHSATLSLFNSVTLRLFTSLPLHRFNPLTFNLQLSSLSPYPATHTRSGHLTSTAATHTKTPGGGGPQRPQAASRFRTALLFGHSTFQHSSFNSSFPATRHSSKCELLAVLRACGLHSQRRPSVRGVQ